MASAKRKKYIYSVRRASGVKDHIQMGKANLLPINPFNNLDPLLSSTQQTQEFDSVIAIPAEQNGLRCSSDYEYDESSDDDLVWQYNESSAFHAFIVDE